MNTREVSVRAGPDTTGSAIVDSSAARLTPRGLIGWGSLALVVGAALSVYLAGGDLPFSVGWDRADLFLRQVLGRIVENLGDLAAAPFKPADRFFLGYVLVSLFVFGAIGFVLYERRGASTGFLAFLFPKRIYLHPSARIDYAVFLINRVFTPAVLFSRLWSAASIGGLVTGLLIVGLGEPMRIVPSGVVAGVLITIVTAMVTDLGDYLSHALLHRIPVMWQFHKLHHSAEVLTPITVARVHPMEQVFGSGISSLLGGVALGVTTWLFLQEPQPLLIFGAQAVSFLFMAAGSHLRHTHVWLSWGPILSRVVISPAQHQIHHSTAPEHLDRNYGFIFALWDWMFGTIYVPREKETLTVGLSDGVREHATVWAAYIDPFKSAAGIIGRWVAPGAGMRDGAAAR